MRHQRGRRPPLETARWSRAWPGTAAQVRPGGSETAHPAECVSTVAGRCSCQVGTIIRLNFFIILSNCFCCVSSTEFPCRCVIRRTSAWLRRRQPRQQRGGRWGGHSRQRIRRRRGLRRLGSRHAPPACVLYRCRRTTAGFRGPRWTPSILNTWLCFVWLGDSRRSIVSCSWRSAAVPII